MYFKKYGVTCNMVYIVLENRAKIYVYSFFIKTLVKTFLNDRTDH